MKWEYAELVSAIPSAVCADPWELSKGDGRWLSIVDALNELGQEGWELAAMRGKRVAILKRPVKPHNVAMIVPLVRNCPGCGHTSGVYRMVDSYTVCARCGLLLAGSLPEALCQPN